MNHAEHIPPPTQEEDLDPRHFYAAYCFDNAQRHQRDVGVVVSVARSLGYPVRYWWLSQAVDLNEHPDRLIVCVHHPSVSSEAGLDLYEALKEEDGQWACLESAAVWEYSAYGCPADRADSMRQPDGSLLFTQDGERSL